MSEFVNLSGPITCTNRTNWIDFLRFERAVEGLLQNAPPGRDWCVAGGSILRALTGEPMSDIDVFCYNNSYGSMTKALTKFMGAVPVDGEPNSVGHHLKYKVDIFIARGVTLPVVYDVIDCGEATSPVEAIERFDFRCLKMYYTGYNLIGDPNALGDIALRRLVFDRPVSKRRVNKYASIAFSPDPVSVYQHGYTSDTDPWWKHFGYTENPRAVKLSVSERIANEAYIKKLEDECPF